MTNKSNFHVLLLINLKTKSVTVATAEWEIFISEKLFKFFVSSTTHVRKLEARANRNHKF